MGKIYEFTAIIQKVEDMDAAYIHFPYDVRKEFGKGRVKVTATFDGVEYHGSLVRMGTPEHIIGITQKIRKEIKKDGGDEITVTIFQRDK